MFKWFRKSKVSVPETVEPKKEELFLAFPDIPEKIYDQPFSRCGTMYRIVKRFGDKNLHTTETLKFMVNCVNFEITREELYVWSPKEKYRFKVKVGSVEFDLGNGNLVDQLPEHIETEVLNGVSALYLHVTDFIKNEKEKDRLNKQLTEAHRAKNIADIELKLFESRSKDQ